MKIEIKRISRKEEIIKKMHTSIKPDTMKAPTHFPCAARVKMPQLGSEDSEIKIRKPPHKSSMFLFHSSDLSQQPVQEAYVKRISRGLSFEEDVVRDRCFHTLPYDSKYFWEVLSLDGLVPLPAKTRIPVGRHNARGSDVRHMPCGIAREMKSHQLKPMKRKIMEKAMQMHQQALMAQRQEEIEKAYRDEKSDEEDDTLETGVFMTEVSHKDKKVTPRPTEHYAKTPWKATETPRKAALTPKEVKSRVISEESETERIKKTEQFQDSGILAGRGRKVIPETRPDSEDVPGGDWDSYLLSILSPLTANWVVHERMTPSEDKENLTKMLSGWYGEPDHTDLVRDDISVTDLELEPQKDKKKPTKVKKEKEATFFDKIKAEVPKRAVDPYSDDNQAPFYRQPAGLRRQRKTEEKEEAGAINSTAHAISVKSYQPSPPPTLRDFINPAVGEKMFDTDNMFEQEWLTGSRQVYVPTESSKIMMESNNKYNKQLQKEYPMSPQRWFPDTDTDKVKVAQDAGKSDKINRGLRRWKALPEPVDDTAEVVNIVPPGYDPEFHRSPDPTTKRITKQNASLMQIIGEWRSKWHLSGQFADSNPMDLIRDMADIQPHVRLKAIATVARAAEYKPPSSGGIHLEYKEKQMDTGTQMPDEVFIALNCLLDDEHDHVRKAAAITLYSLNQPSDQAEVILREALTSDNAVDRWAAAQCLAHFGVCDSDVVAELISQLLDTEDAIKHEQAIMLLSRISNNSILVHCMVAEQLNSTSWRHKVIACKILPTLDGTINKDITNKLSELMWNDWHTDVRKAAAQCLGKTQHGRDVHDDLRDRINSSNERIRLEAISKVGQLGIMTAKLLPAFLKCFDDPYVSVRVETCITSGNLEIQDERVLEKLVYLATYDPIWKVKALSIQALGCIGVGTEEIKDCLMWAMRYEEREGVRAEACHSLVVLGMTDEDFIEVLQDRLLVETSHIVRDEMVEALRQLGVSTTEDMDMVAQIKGEVRKLCHRDVIASHIMVNEMDDDRRENLKRMIYETDRELERYFKYRNRFINLFTKSDMEARIHWLCSPDARQKHLKEHQAKKEAVLKRIQSLSQMSSSGTQPRTQTGSRTSSAAQSREATLFTPSADKELEALMSREDTKEDMSDGVTPTTESVTIKSRENTATGTSLSRPGTSGTRTESQLSSGEEEGDPSHRIKSAASTKSKTGDSEVSGTGSDTPGYMRMDSLSEKKERLQSISEHAQNDSKTNLQLPSDTGLTVSSADVRASRMSFIGGGTSERKALVSRDAMKEREKVSTEALNTYMGLESRYSNLTFELMAIDDGLNASFVTDKDVQRPVQRKQSDKTAASVVITSPKGSAVLVSDSSSKVSEEKDGKLSLQKDEGETQVHTEQVIKSETFQTSLTDEQAGGKTDESLEGQTDSVELQVGVDTSGQQQEQSATEDDSSQVKTGVEEICQVPAEPQAPVQVVVTGSESTTEEDFIQINGSMEPSEKPSQISAEPQAPVEVVVTGTESATEEDAVPVQTSVEPSEEASQVSAEHQAPVQVIVTGTGSDETITDSSEKTTTYGSPSEDVSKEVDDNQEDQTIQQAEDGTQGSPETTVQVVVTSASSHDQLVEQ